MREVRGCTTIFAGRIATTDGSVMSTHSNDGEGATDPRLVRVPPANHPSGALRPVYFSPESYPRYVGVSRGVRAYAPLANQSAFQPIGHIPQVCSASRYLITDFPPPDLTFGSSGSGGSGSGGAALVRRASTGLRLAADRHGAAAAAFTAAFTPPPSPAA